MRIDIDAESPHAVLMRCAAPDKKIQVTIAVDVHKLGLRPNRQPTIAQWQRALWLKRWLLGRAAVLIVVQLAGHIADDTIGVTVAVEVDAVRC